MNLKTKKTGGIILAVFAFIFIILLSIPFFLKDKVTAIIRQELNKQLTADVGFKDLKISLIRNFPNASVSLNDIAIVGRGDFASDTLLVSKDLSLVVNLKSLFGDNGYEIKKFLLSDTRILAHELKDGRVNWDILPADTATNDTASSNLKLKLQDIRLQRTNITYLSDTAAIAARIVNLNLDLAGDFTADKTLLKTRLAVDSLSFWSEGIRYAHDLSMGFNAEIDADLKNSKFTLANNEMKINAIPLSVNGWVQLLDEGMDMDLKLNTEAVDFKSLLSLIPAIYSNSFDKLTAQGNVSLNGYLAGKYVGETYPTFDFNLKVENGKFQYPDLPKSVDNVQVMARVSSPGGSLDNMVVDVSRLGFNMGGNPVSAQLHVVQPMSDPDFRLKASGKLDLAMVKDVYPLEKGTELNGLLLMDVNAAGRMSYVEQNRYENFNFSGNVNVKNMIAKMKDLPQAVSVTNADMIFNNRYLNLSDIRLKIGKNDLNGSGRVENYLAYALRDKTLKGDMKINSTYLNVNDFMGESNAPADTSSMTVIEIPKNLDLNLSGKFNELIYDKMNLKNAEAAMHIAGGELAIQKMNVNAFGGTMALTGKYSSVDPRQPAVNFDVDMNQISFADIFNQVESLQKFVPVFEKLAGRFNTKLSLNTLLAGDMMPILSSVLSKGNFKAEMVTLKEDVAALSALTQSLKIEKLGNLSLKDIAMAFEIKDGRLETKPFDLKFKDYSMSLGGSTGLDQQISYAGNFRLPDKLNLGRFQNVGFKIGGSFQKPKVELDLKNTLNSLLEEEKGKALKKVDSVKNQALDKGRAEREKALQEAQKRADILLEQAKVQGEKLIATARTQGDSIIAKAKNPIAKELAKKGADELVKQARKQADNINSKAKIESDKIIETAAKKTEF